MSNLGKILLYVALVGALAAAGAGGALIYKHMGDAAVLAQANQDRANALQKAKAEAADLEKAQAAQADAESKAQAAASSLDDLKKQMATLQQQATDAAKALADSQAKATTAQDALDKINAALGTDTPDSLKADKKKAEDDLAAAESEKKIMEDQLDQSKQQVADMIDAINRSKRGENKPGVSGKVTFVDRTWNFVVLNVGLQDGLVPNGELIVYRGRNFLGKIRVTKVDSNDAVAEILPDIKGTIEIGDAVLN
jgi:hypothetical protein